MRHDVSPRGRTQTLFCRHKLPGHNFTHAVEHKLLEFVITTEDNTPFQAKATVRVICCPDSLFTTQLVCILTETDTIETIHVLVASDRCRTRFKWAITKLEFVTECGNKLSVCVLSLSTCADTNHSHSH